MVGKIKTRTKHCFCLHFSLDGAIDTDFGTVLGGLFSCQMRGKFFSFLIICLVW